MTEILCTLGPASFNARVLTRLSELGVALFRLNLSHTPLDRLAEQVRFIQTHTKVPLCIDTEGAQVRTANFPQELVDLRENAVVRLHGRADAVAGTLGLYPSWIIERLTVGDFVRIDFDTALGQIIATDADGAAMRMLVGGVVQRNRAVTVESSITLPPLTDKDREAVSLSRELGIKHYALSFANSGADVDVLRNLVGEDTTVIAKIECRAGLANLDNIAARADALLIDRGDLSREIPIERIPAVQRRILKRARGLGRKVYVATNLLESMVKAPYPTRAEVNDIFATLTDGADGLVLAAETAIGAHPIECAGMVMRVIRHFERVRDGTEDDAADEGSPLLIAPHGGRLVRRVATPAELDADTLPRIEIAETDLLDCEQIAHGTYSPLTGFMDRTTLDSVLERNRLPDGTVWTLPILLQTAEAARYRPGDRVALAHADGAVHAVLEITDLFSLDLERAAHAWFGTDSRNHPGVARLFDGGPNCLGGRVTLVRELPSTLRHYQLTPTQTRFLFTNKGWTRIVGFHTRNPAHRGHEHIQMAALERTGADGLFISPVTGPKKRDDFRAEYVLASYQLDARCRHLPARPRAVGRVPHIFPLRRPARGRVHPVVPQEHGVFPFRHRTRPHRRRHLLLGRSQSAAVRCAGRPRHHAGVLRRGRVQP